MWVERSMAGEARCARSPVPVSEGANSSWPAARPRACRRAGLLSRGRSWREFTPNFGLVLGERALELIAQLVRHGDVGVRGTLVHGVELRLHHVIVLGERASRALGAFRIL